MGVLRVLLVLIVCSKAAATYYDAATTDPLHSAGLPDRSSAFVNAIHPADSRKTLLVSTFDGKLTALTFDGSDWAESWARDFDSKPLLSSNIQNVRIYMKGLPYRMIPALDGSLYTYNGRFIEQLPISAESLLRSSFKIGDDILAAGKKESKSYGIKLSDGSLLYECSYDGCQQNVHDRENDSSSGEVLIVQKHSHGVRALDPRTGDEKWNIFTSEYRVSLIKKDSDCHSIYDNRLDEDEYVMLGLSASELVIVARENGTIRSKKKFSSPIAAAWLVKDGHISAIDPFAQPTKTDEVRGGVYIGQASGQLYIQPSLESLQEQFMIEVASPSQPTAQLTFKPSKSTRSATATGKEVAVVLERDLHLGPGYIYQEKCDKSEGQREETHSNTSIEDFLDDDPADSIDQIIIVSLWFWWKEILGISLILAVLLNVIGHYLKKRVKDCLDCESASSSSSSSTDDELCKHRSANSRTRAENLSVNKNDGGAGDTKPSGLRSQSERPFVSRFETEYENILCRGKGGFGVVFEARKSLESVSYAVKRIRMPSKPELHEKVMREVKALANMHHQNIVRYYTSWMEEPPLGWQEDFDRKVISRSPRDSSYGVESQKSSVSAFSTQDQDLLRHDHHKKPIDSISEEDSLRVRAEVTHTSQDSYVVFQNPDEDEEEEGSDTGKGTASFQGAADSQPSEPSRDETKRLRQRRAALPKTFLYIQMELCAKQTLREWLQENSSHSLRDRETVFAIFRQIVEAVDYVHSSGLMHRDLKPSNIFFSSDGAVKVGDFGLVTAAGEGSSSSSSSPDASLTLLQSTSSSSSSTVNHTDNVGTFLYMSPDQLGGVSYSNKVDIYSLGIILYELLVPFKTEMERLHTLKHVRDLSFPQSFCQKFGPEAALLRKLLAASPADRPTAGEILSHQILVMYGNNRLGPPSNRRRTISITDSGDQADHNAKKA